MDRIRASRAALAVAMVGVLAGASLGVHHGPEPPSVQTLPVSVEAPPSTEVDTVHVSGAVVAPGLVTVPAGSRVADAVRAAGGALATADLGALNLAAPVGDGERLIVPSQGAGNRPEPSAGGTGALSLNRATAQELEALPGVGPVLAERIVAHRERIGGFSTVEDLLDVSGIGERTLAEIRDRVTVP